MYDMSVPNAQPGTCAKCNGSGEYRWGAIVNGVATNAGVCYSCGGTGRQARRDIRRNETYNRHKLVALAGSDAPEAQAEARFEVTTRARPDLTVDPDLIEGIGRLGRAAEYLSGDELKKAQSLLQWAGEKGFWTEKQYGAVERLLKSGREELRRRRERTERAQAFGRLARVEEDLPMHRQPITRRERLVEAAAAVDYREASQPSSREVTPPAEPQDELAAAMSILRRR